MALITATSAWQNVTTAGVEFWQCRKGTVLVCNDALPPAGEQEQGTIFEIGEGDRFPAGTIYYRRVGLYDGAIDRGVR